MNAILRTQSVLAPLGGSSGGEKRPMAANGAEMKIFKLSTDIDINSFPVILRLKIAFTQVRLVLAVKR